MGNKQNVEAVTSRGTRRIRENHENFKLLGIRAESWSCHLSNTKHDCFFARDSKSEASYQACVLPPHHAALDYGVRCCNLVAEMTTNHLEAHCLSDARRAMDYIQDNIPIMSFGETVMVVGNTRQGGRNGWGGAWLARWGRDVLGLVGKPDGNRSLGRPGCKWESNIKINLNEISNRGGWVHLSQTRDRNHGYKYLPVA